MPINYTNRKKGGSKKKTMLNNLSITMAQWTNNFIVPMAISAVVIAAYVVLCTVFLKNRGENAKLIPVRVVFFILIALEIAKIFYLIIAMLVAMFLVNIKLSFVFYVMNHQTQLSGAECIRASWKLSKGMFWKIVLFNLSFIGWWILVLVTLGGMYLYVSPYYDTARANLYLDAAGDVYGAGNEVSRSAEAA